MGFTKDDVESLSANLDEPGWLLEHRLAAWGYFEKMELPGEKEEAWRYTNLAQMKFKLDAFTAGKPAPVDAANNADQSEMAGRDGYQLQVNGGTHPCSLDPELAAKGVIFTDIHTAVKEHADLVKQHLFSQTPSDSHIFTALHAALFCGGAFIYVPRGVTVALPIESHRRIRQPGSLFPHSLVIVEEGAELTYFEHFSSDEGGEQCLSLPALEVFAGQASRVTAVTLQDFAHNVWHFQTQHAVASRETTLKSLLVTLGGRFSRQETGAAMKGTGAAVEMLALYYATAGQHFDFRTLQDHAADHCNSDLLYKGALSGECHTVYTGLIHVRPEGAETDAYQTNRNLVLSDHAKADSKPELEIENNDVRCSHAASVGQMNEEEIFYLVSRGIPRQQAERLIVNGFFEEVVGRIKQEAIRSVVDEALVRKLA